MEMRVRFFAAYADALGRSEVVISVPDGGADGARGPATVAQLRRVVERLSPVLPPRPIVAVNAKYASDDQVLAAGDEVAIIPPVAGG